MLSGLEFTLVGMAAVAAGAVNALAGGGTLITFPLLLALGLSPVAANVTNTVALCPAYLGGTLAQSIDLSGQARRLWWTIPPAAVGGVIGGVLLLMTDERVFSGVVPLLILLASGLLAAQEPLRAWLLRHARRTGPSKDSARWAVLPIGLAAIYGGYFGAVLSVIVLAVLAFLIEDTLTRLNALKQALGLIINVAAAILFVFSGHVVWPVMLVMAGGSMIGGTLGGRLAGRIRPATLRWSVVAIGLMAAIGYLARS